MFGMTEQYSTFLQNRSNALPTFGRLPELSSQVAEVMHYDAELLHRELGGRFRLVESSKELHETPFGTTQQFLYCYCRLD
jgi:hypothetical protein